MTKKRKNTSKKNYRYFQKHCRVIRKKNISSEEAITLDLAKASNKWLDNISPRIKETTYFKYQYAVTKYINPYIGNFDVTKITNGTIQDFANTLLIEGGAKGEGLSPKSVSDIVSILKSILRYVSELYGNKEYFFRPIQLKIREPPLHTLTHEEQEILTHYLLENGKNRDIGILLALYTGIRIGELCALTWADINVSSGFIDIESTLTRIPYRQSSIAKTTLQISSPKTDNSRRRIPLPEFLVQILSKNICPDSYVFLSGQPGVYIEPRNMQFYFKRTLKKAHLTDINFHALRHTFATRCISLGFDPKTLSEILGHSSVSITMNKYVHPTMEQKKESMDRLVCL